MTNSLVCIACNIFNINPPLNKGSLLLPEYDFWHLDMLHWEGDVITDVIKGKIMDDSENPWKL